MNKVYQLGLLIIIALGINACSIFKPSAKSNKTVEEPQQTESETEFADNISTESDSLMNYQLDEEMTGDSLSMVEQLFDTTAFIQGYQNKYSGSSNINDDKQMLQGSALLQQLDSLTAVKFFQKYEFVTDPEILNVHGYEPDEVPVFDDSTYEARIAILNAQTPVELVYNRHVKAFINLYAKKGRKQTARMLGLKEIYFPLFEETLDKYNMPLELKYLAIVESALNPTAGSRAGAKGLWQFMYGTGKMYGLQSNSMVDDRFDPYKSTDAAARHLKDLYDIYGTWELALAAYNSGPGNVNRAIRKAGGVKDYWAVWPFLPRETRGYVPGFIAVNYVFNFAAEHNIYPIHPGILHNGIDTVTVTDVLSFDQISEFMHIDYDDLDFLNPSYKQDIIPATNGKDYKLRLPREKVGYFLDHEDSLYNFKSKKGLERDKLLAEIKKAKDRSIHIVRSGENLGLIAKKYRTSVGKLKAWNGLRSTRIYPGQKLIVYPGGNYAGNNSGKSFTKSTNGYHTVRNGENLGLIAKKYGISINQLKSWNNLNGNLIKPGQKLKVSSSSNSSSQKIAALPTGEGYKYHTIKKGDTLWDLAKKYNASVNQIKQWNNISNSYRLKPGQKLIVGSNS